MCGLAFFTGKKSPDINKLTILGMFNDTRGGDSCGISFNNKIWKGTKINEKLFSEFITTFKERDLTGVRTLLIHTRKATSGHGAANAHPFGFRTSSKNKIVVNDTKLPLDFIGMHNGTVKNHSALKSKFDLGLWADMDSKVMLGAIYKHNDYEILKEYEGAAALVWYRGDDLYVFKGGTFDNKFEDRTLFCVEEPEGLYFSSMSESLKAISKNKVIQIPVNKVFRYRKGKLMDTVDIIKPKPALPPARVLIHPNNCLLTNNYNDHSFLSEEVYQNNLRYFFDGFKLHGEYAINLDNRKIEKSAYGNNKVEDFFFLDGIMLKDRTAYNKWKGDFEKIIKSINDPMKIDFKEFSDSFAVPAFLTNEPDQTLFYKNATLNTVILGGELYSDTLVYPITGNYIDVDAGLLVFEDGGVDRFRSQLKTQLDLIKTTLDMPAHIMQDLDDSDLHFIDNLTTALNENEIF